MSDMFLRDISLGILYIFLNMELNTSLTRTWNNYGVSLYSLQTGYKYEGMSNPVKAAAHRFCFCLINIHGCSWFPFLPYSMFPIHKIRFFWKYVSLSNHRGQEDSIIDFTLLMNVLSFYKTLHISLCFLIRQFRIASKIL